MYTSDLVLPNSFGVQNLPLWPKKRRNLTFIEGVLEEVLRLLGENESAAAIRVTFKDFML